MARSYGLEAEQLLEKLSDSTSQSFVTANWDFLTANWPHIRNLGRKDAGLCLETAAANGVSLPLIEARYDMDWGATPGDS